MFGLISGIFQSLTEKKQLNLLLIGLDNAGKSRLLETIKAHHTKHSPLTNLTPTIGLNVGSLTLSSFHIKIWDLGGTMHLRPIWKDYYSSCHAVLFVFTEEHYEKRREEIMSELQRMDADTQLAQAPLLLIYNYQTKDAPSQERIDQMSQELDVFSLKRPVFVSALNASTGKGLNECFQTLINELKNNAREISDDDFV